MNNQYMAALDCSDAYTVLYLVRATDSFIAGPSSSIWYVPGTLNMED